MWAPFSITADESGIRICGIPINPSVLIGSSIYDENGKRAAVLRTSKWSAAYNIDARWIAIPLTLDRNIAEDLWITDLAYVLESDDNVVTCRATEDSKVWVGTGLDVMLNLTR